jgi:hypothetical protein
MSDMRQLKEIRSYESSQYLSTHIYSFQGKRLDKVDQPYTIHVSYMIDLRTERVIDVEPSIRFDFGIGLSVKDVQARFRGASVVARMVRLKSFEEAVPRGSKIESIEVFFRDLGNFNLEWTCNGFIVETEIGTSHTYPQVIRYEAGSGLDPFVDWQGKARDKAFKSTDTLIDPEEGPRCEQEESGVRVFLKD